MPGRPGLRPRRRGAAAAPCALTDPGRRPRSPSPSCCGSTGDDASRTRVRATLVVEVGADRPRHRRPRAHRVGAATPSTPSVARRRRRRRCDLVHVQAWDDDAVHAGHVARPRGPRRPAPLDAGRASAAAAVAARGDRRVRRPRRRRRAARASTSPTPASTSSTGCSSTTRVPNCRSNVLYKGALQGEGAHTRVGRRRADPRRRRRAPRPTSSTATCVLTEGARADSVPNLEIETGEIVGAGHASRHRSVRRRAAVLPAEPRHPEPTSPAAWSCAASSPTSSTGSASPRWEPQPAGRASTPSSGLDDRARGRDRGPRVSAVEVCKLVDVPEGPAPWRSSSTATPIAVVAHRGRVVRASRDICSHADVSLSEGEVDGCTLECWLHGSRFDLRTGEPSGPPATTPVPVYPVSRRRRHRLRDRRLTPRENWSTANVHPGDPRPARHRRGRRRRQGDPDAASTSPSAPGETHAIMGPNGSGKSTLAYAIAGHPKYTITVGHRHPRRRRTSSR